MSNEKSGEWEFQGLLPEAADTQAAVRACRKVIHWFAPGESHEEPVNAFHAGFLRGVAYGIWKATGEHRQVPPPRRTS